MQLLKASYAPFLERTLSMARAGVEAAMSPPCVRMVEDSTVCMKEIPGTW